MARPPRLLSAGSLAIIFTSFLLLSGAVSANKCIVGCHGIKQNPGYAEGSTYVYGFEGTSVTSVSEGQGSSAVKLSATVELSIKPDCVHQLKLKNVLLNGAPVNEKDVEQHGLQFNYHNGHVDTSICTEPNDSQASLNIKRAVASLFQSSAIQESGTTSQREIDVFGNCETNFEFNKQDNGLTVRKHKNLGNCFQRENMRHGLIHPIYDESSDIKTSPILDSHQNIEQKFQNGILNNAKSVETYNYRPFTNGEAGAKTVIETNLQLKKVNQQQSTNSPKVSIPKSLIFEAPHPVVKSSVDGIIKGLKAVKDSKSNTGEIKIEAAEKFGELIKVLRKSTKNDIIDVYQKVKSGINGFNKNTDKKILLDALYRTGTGEAAEVAVELIKTKQLNKYQEIGYLASLSLVDHVNLPAVSAVVSLLNEKDLPRIGYLGIGNIIGKYCRDHNCENVGEIKQALGKITSKIGDGRAQNRQAENELLGALKAISNAKYLDDQTIEKLLKIIKNKKDVTNRVRVGAIESLSAKCSMKWKLPLLDVFGDHQEDSEIRIKAYLSLIVCPCATIANKIKEIIDKETVNQVGSFVTTHLNNLRATTDPTKYNAKKYFEGIKPRNKFPIDFRKFSFNNELSYKIDQLGIGSTIEQNVIYSEKSFVPRSASLNLTTQLFGRSFNFLEIDTRIENLDKLIEHYFGPKGFFKQSEVSDLIINGKKTFSDVYKHVSERVKTSRSRRSPHTSLDKFSKTIKMEENEVDDDIDIDLSIKMFGLELAFIDFNDNTNNDGSADSTVDKIFKLIEQAMGNAKNFDYTVSNHVHFLDAELIYPTGLGFPLTIGIEGNGVTHIKTNGKIDFQSIIKDPKNGVVKFGFEPSASITIAASLSLHTFGVDNGLKVIGNLHTSTGSDVSLKILDGNGFDINFGIPKKKQEIISLTSQVIFIDKNGQQTPTKFSKGKEHSDCFDQLSSILGLTVCGQFSYPYESIGSIEKRPFFPMGGPGKFAISIENNDVTSYHFRVFYDKSKQNYRSLELLFNTPNSRYNRKVSLRLEGSNEPAKKYVKAQLESPFKNIDGQLLLENNDKKKGLTASLRHDNDNYYGSIGIVANGNKYKPILEYRMPDHIAKLAGGNKPGDQQSAYKLDGDIQVSDHNQVNKKYEFNKVTLVAHGKKLASLDGSVITGPNILTLDTRVSHNDENIHINFDGKLNDNGLNVNLAFVPSKNTDIAFQIVWQSNIIKNEKIDHSFVLTYGSDLKSKINRISLIEGATYKKNEEQLSLLKWKSELTWPAQDLSVKFETEYSPKNLDTEFDFHYGKFKFGTDFEIEIEQENPSNWNIELEGYVVDNKIALKAKHKKLSESKRKFDGQLVVPGAKYEIETVTVYHIEGYNVNVGFETKLKLNGKQLDVSYGVDKTPQKINSHAHINFDNTKYLDFILKGTKGAANSHGEFNLDVKKLLILAGQFTYQSGKGTLTINVDLPKFDRKIKTTGDITVVGSRHTGNLLILLDAEKDPNKRIKLSTDSDLTKTSIDTKNIIEILSYKTEINAKGKLIYKQENDYNFEGNFNLHLPNDRYIVGNGKGSVNRHNDNKITQIHGHYEFMDHEKKSDKPRTISYVYELSVDQPKYNNAQTKHKIQFTNVNNQNLELHFNSNYVKPANINEPQKGNIEITLTGNYLPKPFKFSMSNEHSIKETSSWKIDSSLGNDLTVKSAGSYFNAQNAGNDNKKPCTSSVVFELKLPNDKLRNLKYESKNSLLLPQTGIDKFSYSTVQTLIYNDDKKINGEISIENNGLQSGQRKDGKGKLKLSILQYPALTIDTNVKYDPSGEEKKADGTLVFAYGEKKINFNIDAAYTLDMYNIGMNIKTTSAGIDKLFQDAAFGFERKYDNGPWKYNAYIINDKNKYEINSEFDISNPNSRRVDIKLTCPNGKTEIYSMVNILSENEYKGEWRVNSPKGFANADGHIKFINVDDFIIDFNFDSDKLKERKIHAEIASKPGVKPRKSITLTVTSDGKNIITGATNYNKREEANKVIIEGSGDLTIGQNEKRSSKFIYSRKQLTKENDGETGVAISLNANFDPSAVVGEIKISDKEVHIFNSFCEKSKDCANFNLQSIIHSEDGNKAHIDHEITVEVNLKKFYVPVEFGLKTTNKYHPKELTFDHTANLYLHTAKDKTEYSSHIYANPRESGIIFTVPSREFALIGTVNLPKSKTSIVGPYKIDISAYLDRKNHPNDKTSLIAAGDVKIDKNSAGISGDVRFIYPKQTRELIIKGQLNTNDHYYLDANLEFDLFAKKTQKINAIAKLFKTPINQGCNVTGLFELSSNGQQLKVDVKQNFVLSKEEINVESSLGYNDKNQRAKIIGLFFNVNPYKKVHFKIQGPNKCILHTDTTIELTKNIQKIETKYEIYENPAIVTNAEIRDLNSFTYQSFDQSKPNDKLSVSGKAIIGQVVEFHGDVFQNGEKKNLFNVAIYLDESRFLKPNLAYNKDNVIHLIDYYREKMIKYANVLKEAGKEIGDEAVVEFKDLFDHLKKSQANLKPLIDYYQGELVRLKNEIQNDKTLHEIIDAYSHVFGGFTKAVTQVIKQLIEQLEQLQKQYVEIVEKISEAIKATWPQIKQSIDKILKASIEIFDATTKLGATYVKALLNIVNEHQKEIREILTLLSEIVRDIMKIVSKGIHQIEGDVKNFITVIVQQIKALPISELIKKKWIQISNYQIPEEIVKPIEEVFIQMIKILPTEELRQFGQLIHNYIMKLIKHQKIDGGAEIKNIYSHGIDAVRSVISLLQEKEIDKDFYGLFGHNFYANFGYIKYLPGLPIIKLSIINLIKNGEFPKINDLYYTYRPTAYLSDIIPPFSKMAVVVDGGHFFTFDERHLTLPGTCDYLLAHDTQDGNFSIVASLNDGKLASVTVTAPGESITLKSNGNILVDDKPGEYPASTKNLHAFLTLPSVNVKSDYGVHVICSQKAPMICAIRVSGFYHGKLRGIFGNANNEPYDDFILPSGDISEKESNFGNAYQLNGACPAVPSIDHHSHHNRNPTCTNYFADSSSSMSPCFNYADPTLFRQACDHATAANTPRAACLISAAYYAVCKSQRIDISIPTACGNCKLQNDVIPIGNSFSLKIPNKQADVVFVVEQTSKNDKIYHELITPLMTEVKNELKNKGINDVHIGLIGYGEHMKWPQHYTTGGSTNINGQVNNIKFVEAKPLLTFNDAKNGDFNTRVKYAKERADVELGTFKLTDAYEEAINYPFRTGAAKVVVGIIASPCEKSPLPLSLQQLRLFLGQKIYRDLGLAYHHIGFLNDILVSGKSQKNVVGYDSEEAYTFSDSKKNPLDGSIEKSNLVLTSNDVCAGFAVSSGGAAFSSNHFLEAKPNQKKQFLQVTARRIAEGIADSKLGEDCVCTQRLGLYGHASCKVVDRKEK